MGSADQVRTETDHDVDESIEVIRSRILSDITEGIMLIGFNGFIMYANTTASRILGIPEEDMIGHSFASLFFDKPENDEFSQAVIESIYDRERSHDNILTYENGDKSITLRMKTSFYIDGVERKGIIAVFSDVTEFMELQDAVRSMNKIRALNDKLELRNKLLSETFGRFLSDEIVKKLLDTPDGLKLGGEKRTLTIMMSDLRGFTALSERMDAADLIALLNHYLEEMTLAIQKHGGTIIEFIGDGILAIYGAPDYFADHASKAVAAAVEMQSRMPDINKWNEKRGYPPLEMGIGINTGEVIVGNIGSEKRTKYGVAGAAVNMCGRIESYTTGGQILIHPGTKEAIKEDLEISKEITVYPKGAKGELLLSQVIGIGQPYDLHYAHKSKTPDPLLRPAPVCFHRLEGKHKIDKDLFGGIVAVANDRAIFSTDTKMELLDNIVIEAGGDLYCKVLKVQPDGYLIQYTAIPAGYGEWITRYDEAQ
ncbi:MAG: PAS domain S-box protein [Lachnospiraceae bacterium]|nr:PAS domain S-box protein [Lachnospiraceae bacterium]